MGSAHMALPIGCFRYSRTLLNRRELELTSKHRPNPESSFVVKEIPRGEPLDAPKRPSPHGRILVLPHESEIVERPMEIRRSGLS